MGNFDFLMEYDEYELYEFALEAENLYKYGHYRASLNSSRIFLEACCEFICYKFNETPVYRHVDGNKNSILDISNSFQKVVLASDNTRIDIEKITNDIRHDGNDGSHYKNLTTNELIRKANLALNNLQNLAKWYIKRVHPKSSSGKKLPNFMQIKPIDIENEIQKNKLNLENLQKINYELEKEKADIEESYFILEKDYEETQEKLNEKIKLIKENQNTNIDFHSSKMVITKNEYEKLKKYRDEKIHLEGKIHYLVKNNDKLNEKLEEQIKKTIKFDELKNINANLENINITLGNKINELKIKNQELENIIKDKIVKIENIEENKSKNVNNEIQFTNEIENDVYKTIQLMESLGVIYITQKTIPNFLAGVVTAQTTVFGLNTYEELFGKYKNKEGIVKNIYNAIQSLLDKNLILAWGGRYSLKK